jgi:serine/threonine protein kinase
VGTLDELERLGKLRSDGVLTQAEFEAQKAVLLSETAAADRSLPQQIGAYRVLGLLGEGGMGTVYRARHVSEAFAARQGGDIALKVMLPHLARSAEFRQRFEREAELGLHLDHPGIVKVHELLIDGEALGLVMELLPGRSLELLALERGGPLPWPEAVPIFRQVLAAVAHAHAEGVVHRDLKPENVLVADDGTARVLDFGVAKVLDSRQTKTGATIGTLDFMAPEQYGGAEEIDARADIYSLGLVLHRLLVGRLPWTEEASPFEVMRCKGADELPPASSHGVDLPEPLSHVIARAVRSQPVDRPESVQELARIVETAVATLPGGDTLPAGPRIRTAPEVVPRARTLVEFTRPAGRGRDTVLVAPPEPPKPALPAPAPKGSSPAGPLLLILGAAGVILLLVVVAVLGLGVLFLMPGEEPPISDEATSTETSQPPTAEPLPPLVVASSVKAVMSDLDDVGQIMVWNPTSGWQLAAEGWWSDGDAGSTSAVLDEDLLVRGDNLVVFVLYNRVFDGMFGMGGKWTYAASLRVDGEVVGAWADGGRGASDNSRGLKEWQSMLLRVDDDGRVTASVAISPALQLRIAERIAMTELELSGRFGPSSY